jgi:hypothetical protein
MKAFFIVLAALLAGCSTQTRNPTQVWAMAAAFDKTQAERLMQDGSNQIRGNGFMRQRGGGVVTCAGQLAMLIPATEYAKERMFALYGPGDSGTNVSRNPTFQPDVLEYGTLTRSTKCDAQGNFTFDRVADGEFFVNTMVTWSVGYSSQGGYLMHKVTVKNGQSVNVILSS